MSSVKGAGRGEVGVPERRCRNCYKPVRWHLLATVRMACERVGGLDPMDDEEGAIYEAILAEDAAATSTEKPQS